MIFVFTASQILLLGILFVRSGLAGGALNLIRNGKLFGAGLDALIVGLVTAAITLRLMPSNHTPQMMMVAFACVAVYQYTINRTWVYLLLRYGMTPDGYENRPHSNLAFNWETIRPIRALHGIAKTSVVLVLFAVFFVQSFGQGQFFVAILVGGVLSAGLYLLQSGIETENTVRVHLELDDVMRASRRSGLIAAIVAVLVGGIPLLLGAIILGISLKMSLLLPLLFIITTVGQWFRYLGKTDTYKQVLKFLHYFGILPSDFFDFLDYATNLILIRKVGNGYIFIHRYLLEYFADLETEKDES
jgi:hypothetical protein